MRIPRVYRLPVLQALIVGLVLLLAPGRFVFADNGNAGCAACGGFSIILLAMFALSIALLVWVARDAKARGMDSAVLWMLLVFFTNVIGLIIYIFSRPQGNLIRCAHCNNSRLQASAKCPHCGNA